MSPSATVGLGVAVFTMAISALLAFASAAPYAATAATSATNSSATDF